MTTETLELSLPTLAAARIELRPIRMSDKGLLEMYAGDKRVADTTRSIPHPLPPGATEAFIRRSMAADRREHVWIMDGTRAQLGEVVGCISLTTMEDGPASQVEIGYWVAPALWNTGLASEAVATLLKSNPVGAKTVFAEVFQGNDVSARVLTNVGFEYLGDAEAFSVARNAKVATWTYLLNCA